MTIEKSYFDFLSEELAAPGYYVTFPDNVTFPAWRLQRIRGSSMVAHDGDLGAERAILQVSCYAKTYQEVKELAGTIKTLSSGYCGLIGEIEARIFILSETDLYESSAKVHHVALGVEILANP